MADVTFPATTCTNQFLRSLAATGVGTCATVANADLANSTITLNAGASTGLTAPGAMTLGSTYTVGAITDEVRFTKLGLGVAPTYDLSIERSSTAATTGSFPGIRVRNTSIASNSISDVMAEATTAASVAVQTRIFSDGLGTTVTTGSTIAGSVGTRSNHPVFLTTNNLPRVEIDTSGVVTLLAYGTGLLHSSSAGVLTASLLVDADITNGTISSAKLIGTDIVTVGTIASGTWNAAVIAGLYGGTGVANSGKTITLGGNLPTSDAFATPLTVTAATGVTLPTTGTLAALAGSEALTNKTVNGLTITTSTGTLTVTNGKTASVSNTLTLAGTDSTTITFQGTDTYVGRTTTDTLTNKTLTSPTLTTPTLGVATATSLKASGVVSAGTVSPVAGYTLIAHAATDENLGVAGHFYLADGVSLSSVTDAGAVAKLSVQATTLNVHVTAVQVNEAATVSQTFTMCKTGACATTCTIITTHGLVTGGTC